MNSEENNNSKLDFPFYNDNPPLKAKDIAILALLPIFFTIYTFLPWGFPGGTGAFIFCLTQLFAILYVSRFKISTIIKKPKIMDFVRIIVTLIIQFIVSIVVAMILKYVLHANLNGNTVLELEMGVDFWIKVIFQLFGEELYKVLIFLAVLVLMYKYTKKRTLSIVVATTVSLLFFAIIHMTTYASIVQVLLLQGLVSLISFYNYLKTKNILTSYLQHVLFDAIPFLLSMFHILDKFQ